MPKKTDNPRKIRNMRFTDDEWVALGNYAKEMGTTRTGVVVKWIETLVPPSCFPSPEPPEGMMNMFDFIPGGDMYVPTRKEGE